MLKTIRDRAISGKFWIHRVIRTTPLGPLKNEDFSEFSFLNFVRHL